MGMGAVYPALSDHVGEPFRTALCEAVPLWSEQLGEALVSIVLYGSVARGDAEPRSDIDLLFVVDDAPSSHTARREPLLRAWEQHRHTRALPTVTWSFIVKTRDEARVHSPLYLDMVEDAVLLLDREGFFESVLEEMRDRMRQLGSRRVHLPDGSWYWDLKPDYQFGEVVEI